MLNAPEGGVEQAAGQAAPVEQQEHQQQYLIVNQPQAFSDHHSHSVAASLSPTPVAGPAGHVYSTIYHSAQGVPQASGYAMKYLPTYSQASAGQLQQPAVQKVYSVIESPQMQPMQQQPLQQQMAVAQPAAPIMQVSYEPSMEQVQQPASGTRYISCIDTCNSADPRWRKYTVSRYRACCSRSSQFDASYEQPSADKVGESSARYAEDTYYSYLQNRRSRSKRARRQRSRQYSSGYGSAPSSSPVSGSYQEDEAMDSGSPADGASRSGSRASYQEPAQMKYYKPRSYGSSSSSASDTGAGEPMGRDETLPTSGKYSSKGRAGRRSRSRDFDAPVESAQPLDDNVEDGSVYPREPSTRAGSSSAAYSPSLASSSGYGGGDHSVDLQGRGYGSDSRANGDEEDSPRYDEPAELEPGSGSGKSGDGQDYPGEVSGDSNDEPEQEPATSGAAYRYPSGAGAHKRKSNKSRRRPAAGKEQSKTFNSWKKPSSRKSKSKYDNGHSSSNATDYESAQPGEQYQDQSSANASSQDQEDHSSSSSYSAKEPSSSYENGDSDKEPATGSKYRTNINDTAVANLSKTTLHLKEILSILEKKAYAKGNESLFSEQSQKQQQQSQPGTSTSLPPVTTTISNYPLSLLGSPYSSSLSSDFLSSDFGSLKSPYKFDHSFSGGSLGSSSLSLPSSFSSFGSDSMTQLSPSYPSPYALHTGGKHMGNPNGPHPRKRRVNKNARYNELMLQKAAQSLAGPSSLLQGKNRFLSPSYYSALQYPYLYRGATQSLTNPYPYKNHHKNPYSSLLSGSMSSKLAAAAAANPGNMYTDESRLHGLTGLDPLANMASSLRPSAAMRLRSKPFIFQPQVLPIYTRHSILAQPLDGKA